MKVIFNNLLNNIPSQVFQLIKNSCTQMLGNIMPGALTIFKIIFHHYNKLKKMFVAPKQRAYSTRRVAY